LHITNNYSLMSTQYHILLDFIKELKRRKVLRVITVYAASAFVILELADILAPSLRLPDWTVNLVLLLLCVGFVVAVILSWIYDVHPEEGVVRTEPSEKVKAEDVPKSSNGWKIASYISFVVIVGLMVLNIIPRFNNKEILEKSIAVLPFDYLGSDEENSHIGRAFTDEIIMELQKIKSFDRVLSYTSTLQYEEQRPTIPEIGEKQNVNYIIEGTIQQQGDNVSINVQVIIAKDDNHIWAKEFNGLWQDIYSIQDEIAFKVAHELNLVLSPEEKKRIEKIPTYNPLAHEFYQRGRDQIFILRSEFSTEALEKGGEFFRKAIELDRTFAPAYTGLAWIYFLSKGFTDIFSENYLDSLITLADAALFYDNQLAEAHTIKGLYYSNRAQPEKALAEFDMAIELNPNDWMAYENKGFLYIVKDLVKSLDNYHKAANLNLGEGLLPNLRVLQIIYSVLLGMEERGAYYARQVLELSEDSADYYQALAYQEQLLGNYERSNEYFRRVAAIDSSISVDSNLGLNAFMLRKFEEAHTYYEQFFKAAEESIDSASLILSSNVYGYLLWEKGYWDQAGEYFDKFIDYNSKIIELGGRGFMDTFEPHLELATVYAFRGEKEKAFEHLILFNQRELMFIFHVTVLKDSPFFDNIRDEPEFQQIVSDVEAKYQAEHERVRQWLEENDML